MSTHDLRVIEVCDVRTLESENEAQQTKTEAWDKEISSSKSELQGNKRDKDSGGLVLSSEGDVQKTIENEDLQAVISCHESKPQKIQGDEDSHAVILSPKDETFEIIKGNTSDELISFSEGGTPVPPKNTSDRCNVFSENEIFETKTGNTSDEHILSLERETRKTKTDKLSEMVTLSPKCKTQETKKEAADSVILPFEFESEETKIEKTSNAAVESNAAWKVENPYQTVNSPARPLTIYCEIDELKIENVKNIKDGDQCPSKQDLEHDLNQSASPQDIFTKNILKDELGDTLQSDSAVDSSNNTIPDASTSVNGKSLNTSDHIQQNGHLCEDNRNIKTCNVRKSKVVTFMDTGQEKFAPEHITKENFDKETREIENTELRDKNSSRDRDTGSEEKTKTKVSTTACDKIEGKTLSSMTNELPSLGYSSKTQIGNELIPSASGNLDETSAHPTDAECVHHTDAKMVLDLNSAAAANDSDLDEGRKNLQKRVHEMIPKDERIIKINAREEELRFCTSEGTEGLDSSNAGGTKVKTDITNKITEGTDDKISAVYTQKIEVANEPGVVSDNSATVAEKAQSDETVGERIKNAGTGEGEENEDTNLASKLYISPNKTEVDEHGRPIRKSLSSVARTSSLKQKAYNKFTHKDDDGTEDKTAIDDKTSENRKVTRSESFTAKALKIIHRNKSEVIEDEDNDEVDMRDKTHGQLYMRKKRMFSPWRKHFFVLDGSQLTYYRSRQHFNTLTGCQGVVDLTLLHDVVKKKPSTVFRTYYPLLLERRSLSTIMLGADCEAEQLRWLELLQRALGARKAASRKFSAKVSTSKSSLDVVASTLPSSSKKKRKNSFGRSLSFRRRSKEKLKDECDSNEYEKEDNQDSQGSDFKKCVKKIEQENNSDNEEKELVKPKKILKTGVLLPAGEINSVRLKKVHIEGNNTKETGSSNAGENEKQCPEQMFGVQLKKTSYKEKYLHENGVKVREESGNEIEGGHDFRSLLRSRRTSTTGVDKNLYVKYRKDPAEPLERGEKSPRKRSPSPSLPLSKSLLGVLNRSTENDDLVLEGQTGTQMQKKYEGPIRTAKSNDMIDTMNGKMCSVNHANADVIRYSDPPNELETVNEGFKAHPKLELKFSEERRESSLLETFELMDDSSVIKDSNVDHENVSLEFYDGIKRSKTVDAFSNSDDIREKKVSSVTNIILQPVSKARPSSSFNLQQNVSENKVLVVDFRKSSVDADKYRENLNCTPILSYKVSDDTCKKESTGEYRGHLFESEQSKGEDKDTFELETLSKQEKMTGISESKQQQNSAPENNTHSDGDEQVFVDAYCTGETEKKSEARMKDILTENFPVILRDVSTGNDEEKEDCAVVRHNNTYFSFRSPSRNSEPASFDDHSPNTSLESRRTSEVEYSTTFRPDLTPQISVARSSSAESGEPLARTSFMGGRLSWGSASNFNAAQCSSSDTNTSKDSIGSSSTNPSRRHSYGNDLTVPDVPNATRIKTSAVVSDQLPFNSSGAVIKKITLRKRQERPTSASNRESLISPEFAVMEEDVNDTSPLTASTIQMQSDVQDDNK
ncbi:PH domain-like [Trinorchestia longiramus]|nr:PH domain-like [Trinorchestia longiramus]